LGSLEIFGECILGIHLSLDFRPMVVEIGQGGINVRNRDLRKFRGNFRGSFSVQFVPDVDVPHADASAGNARFPAANIGF
jgi:hypothetical protein